ncbi:MAG: hypothetical protein M3O46_00850, partial [Myxococcota bacterium]|nr:hypothetical protein [Myxococcota bacterium]
MHLRSLPKIATAVAALLLATGCSSKNDSKGGATGKSSGGGLADVGSPDVGASEANAGPDATDGPDAGAAIDRFPDQAAGDPACASSGNNCNTLPAPECEGSVLKTYYDPNGTCVAGVCQYRYTSQTCAQGCHAGQCDPSSCDGSPSCNVPSPCDGSPSCHGGAPPCEGSTCNTGGDLCAQVHCDSLPANVCVGSDLHTYVGPQGMCTQGVCSYTYTTQTCADGCSNGACIVHVCTPGSATFSADVTNVDSLATVSPLPALAGGAGYEIRSYMTVKDSYIGVQVPIYAPTNMTIQASVHYYDPLHNP